MIKGISSREFFKAFKTNRLVYRKLWGRSYYAEKINDDKYNIVINYIENQINEDGFDKRYSRPK
jgi:REP element-mobilizing transposase RayT